MIKKIGLKKVLLIIVLLILGIVSILLAILLNNKKEVEIPEIEQPPSSGLLGNDRIEAQEKVYAIIGNYIKNIPDLSNYIQNSEIKIFSLKALKEKFNFNTDEFENIEYKCDLENTTIDFTKGVENYIVSLSCEAFLLKR